MQQGKGGKSALDIRVNQLGGGTPVSPTTAAVKLALSALGDGFEGVKAAKAEVESTLRTALLSPAGEAELKLTGAVLDLALTGKVGLDARVTELEGLLLMALLTPEGAAAVHAEIDALKQLSSDLGMVDERLGKIDNVLTAGLVSEDFGLQLGAERAALVAFNHGEATLAREAAVIDATLQAGTASSALEQRLSLERAALEAVQAGAQGIDERLTAIANFRMVARLTPEGVRGLDNEEATLRALAETFASLKFAGG
jgi:hypothetical protein